jgi:uncharacterized protein YdhG (YjbR/CyaY superfamily)
MKTLKPADIDAYIAAFPDERRYALQELRTIIHNAVPEAVETISYGMPAFKWGGVSVWFAAYKHHLSVYPVSDFAAIQAEMAAYRAKETKASLHFPYNEPLPVALIEKIVRYKLIEKQEFNEK